MQQQITIKMIEDKVFRVRPHGYDQEEVDVFLDEICDEMSRQQDRIAALSQQVEQLTAAARNAEQAQPVQPVAAPVPTPAEAPVQTATMEEVLTAAVRFKEQIEREAKTKADAMVAEAAARAAAMQEEAENQATERLKGLTEEHDRLAAQVETLRKAGAEYREAFAELLKKHQQALEESDDLF